MSILVVTIYTVSSALITSNDKHLSLNLDQCSQVRLLAGDVTTAVFLWVLGVPEGDELGVRG